MDNFLFEQVVAPTVKFVTSYITKHIGYFVCSTKHVKHMLKRMKELEGTRVDFKKRMESNNKNNIEVPTGLSDWLKGVENVMEKDRSISNGNGCFNLEKRYRAGSEAWKDTETIEELIKQASSFDWSDVPIPTGRVDSKPATSTLSTPPPPSPGRDGFKSREKPFKDALEFLREDGSKSQVIALCGMGGVGKTTMMKQLKKIANKNNLYNYIVTVVIGRLPDIYSIQNDISVNVGGKKLLEEDVTARGESIRKKVEEILKKGEKILVIADDVWEEIELLNIGLTSPLPNGIKLFLTSRHTDTCKKIADSAGATLRLVSVDALDEAEARAFFSQITEISEEYDSKLYHIGCDIVKKCGRLPLAIKLIAQTLKFQKDDDAWENARDKLNDNELDINIQKIIKISYDYLESDEDKKILLHCGLFPEDTNISIELLTRYAWGLKMFKNIYTLGKARARTKTCVQSLMDANLLINGDHHGTVKMHDLVLVFVVGTITSHDFAWIIRHGDISKWRRDEMSKSSQRISLTCTGMSEFPRDFKYPNLSLLQLMRGDSSLKFPEDFYKGMEDLSVIAYYNMQYPLLPRSLEWSTNLTTLILHGCELAYDCSFIGDLKNLEVLSFAYCGLRKLPSAIGNLENLRLLDVTGNINLRIDNGVFQKLVNLEELYMITAYTEAIGFTDANVKELETLSKNLYALQVEFFEKQKMPKNMSFEKLEKFMICMGCFLEEDDDVNIEKILQLVTDRSSDIWDCNINKLFKKTEKLNLQVNDMIRLEDVVPSHPYGQHPFPYLKDLEVSGCGKLKYLFTVSMASGLKKIERLKVSSCSVLETLVHYDENEINSESATIKFEKLKFMCLEKLPKLVSLFHVDNVVELPELAELEVEGLPNFTSIYQDQHNSPGPQQPLFNTQVKLSKLEKLRIKSMEMLKEIWGCEIANTGDGVEEDKNISLLREIRVEKCDRLVNLFPTNPVRLLNHLKKLQVIQCGSVEVIFNIDLERVVEVGSSNLRSIKVEDSKNLKAVWRIKGVNSNSCSDLLIGGFEAVESIRIDGCKRFRNVFTPTNTKFDLRALVDIYISKIKFDLRALVDFNISKLKIFENQEEEMKEGDDDDNSSVLFPSSVMHTFHYLNNLHLEGYNGVEVVFDTEGISRSSESITTTNNQLSPLLPNLQVLSLSHMERMNHVWKWNDRNTVLNHQKQSLFHNLTTIHLFGCNRIKYLFSPLMAKLLSNLKEIMISYCNGMEEVVSKRYNKDEELTASATTNLFLHLHSLHFKSMRSLKHIGGYNDGSTSVIPDQFKSSATSAPWSLCQYARQIEISSCDSLSSVIPYYAVGRMKKLQVLDVKYCDGLTEVFESQGINKSYNDGAIGDGSGTNTSLAIQRLQNYVNLSGLTKLEVYGCNLLQHVFTFSTLESLTQLEKLSITDCKAMRVIVKKESAEQSKVVVFPRLKSLKLCDLPNLEGFFLGMNEFVWGSLETVMLDNCPQMKVFANGHSEAPNLKYIHTRLGKHSLECGLNFHLETPQTLEPSFWSYHNLIEINGEYDMYTIPSNVLPELQKLERIRHEAKSPAGYRVKEVLFGVVEREGTNSGIDVVEIPNLRQVELEALIFLKYLWKSNHHGTILQFPNLTTLYMSVGESLEHVFTSSMVGSLLQLQELHISFCKKIEVIVKVDQEESEVRETELPRLKSLKLERLDSLKGFCLGKADFSLPSLHVLEIKKCPQIEVFTNGHVAATPVLNSIDTSFGRCYLEEEEDINSFIKTKRNEGLLL